MKEKIIVKQPCPICESTGKLFIKLKVGDLARERETSCYCWMCRGTGSVEFYPEKISSTKTIVPEKK